MFGNFIIQIKNGKANLNKDIFLNKNDKDVVIYFKVNGFPYKFSNNTEDSIDGAVYSQITLQKPTGEVILLPKTAVDVDKITLKITEDIIDEVIEIGEYNFQVKLFGSDDSEISLPVIYNQFHVNPILDSSTNTDDVINQNGVGYGHISLSDDIDIFKSDKSYNKTIWNDKDLITTGKMNKIENSLSYLLDKLIVNHTPVDKSINLSLDKYQNVITNDDLVVNLPVIDFHSEFILYINTLEAIYVTFKSAEKDYNYRLAKGYYKCRLSYIGTWLVEIIMDNNNIDFDGFASEKELKDLQNQVRDSLAEVQTKFDNRYADKNHIHENYVNRIDGTIGLLLKEINDYYGMINENGNDTKAIRTTKEGLIPYGDGNDSSIGTNDKRFLYGYFSKLISNELNTANGNINNLNVDNEININSEGKIKYNSTTGQFELLKNGDLSSGALSLGYLEVNGTRIYVGTSFPKGARENDILIKIDGASGTTTPITRYTITNKLTNVNTDNTSTSIEKNASYSAILTPYSGYSMKGISVTMGGNDITNSCLANNEISIANVTGNIVITANASVIETTSLPDPVFELHSSNFTSNDNTWIDLIGDKTAKITGTVAKVGDMVRFDKNKYFICNISSLNLKSYTLAMRIQVNPTGATIPSAGNNVITIGTGTSTWKDNMACNILPTQSTKYYALINGESASGDEATGTVTIILRHDAVNKKIILNVGSKKFEKTYTETASALKYIYNQTNTACDYKYIKLYNSVFTDTQITELLDEDNEDIGEPAPPINP